MKASEVAEKVISLARHLNYLQGKRCARHQISTVLLCGLAITSLFYPAFGLLLWTNKSNRFWDINSSNFKSADFYSIWDTHYSFSAGLSESGSNYNAELLVSPFDDYYEDLLKDITTLSSDDCLKSADNCIILSPLSQFYNDSESTLAQFNSIPYAVTTILFNDNHDHANFNAKISSLDAYAEPSLSTHKEISIHQHQYTTNHSSLPYIFGVAYALFIIYVSVSVSRLNEVHSRFGLAITGIAQLCVSTIMSISLLELCDWRLRLVPWTVVPFVIVVVGVENMLTIARAVVSTSISLPVPERVGQGMAKVGPVIGLTVLSDLTLLGIAGYLVPGMIREFCIFASVVSVIDYFLQSTFFITILSVDIQRLELSDLIHQGLQPVSTGSDGDVKKQNFTSHPLIVATKAVWKARSTRNASLLVLILIISTLYYVTLPSQPLIAIDALSQANHIAEKDIESTSEQLWSILSQAGKHSSVNMHINPPTFLTTYASQALIIESERNALFSPRTRAFLWTMKVVVAPIGSSLIALYCLLLFLLKDKELHELQRSKLDESVSKAEDTMVLRVDGCAKVIDRKADITHVAASTAMLAYSTMLNDVVVLRDGERFLLSSSDGRVTALVSNDDYVAIGMDDGTVKVWNMRSEYPSQQHLAPLHQGSSVTALAFMAKDVDTSPATPLRSPYMNEEKSALVCVYFNKSAVVWPLDNYERFSITDQAAFVHLSSQRISIGVADSDTLSIFDYDWQTRSKSLLGSLEHRTDDTFVDLVQVSRQGFVKSVAFMQTTEGAIRAVELEEGYSEVLAELDAVPSVTNIEIVKPESSVDDIFHIYVIRGTLHSVYIDVIDVCISDGCIGCGGGALNGTTIASTSNGNIGANTSTPKSTFVPSANSTALTPTPMLLRNRSRKSGGGSNQSEDGGSYPLANHGFSRRVSAAKGDNDTDDKRGSSQCTHTQPVLTFDARFNTFATLSNKESVAGVSRNGCGWEAWCVRLSAHEDKMELETTTFTIRDVESTKTSRNSTHTSSRTPRLHSLLNDEHRRRDASKTPSNAILPTSRILGCVAVSSTQTLLAFSNAVVMLEYNHSTAPPPNDKKHL